LSVEGLISPTGIDMGNLSGMEEMNNYCDKRVHMGTKKRGFTGLDGWKSY
jgi:hypothetical protein